MDNQLKFGIVLIFVFSSLSFGNIVKFKTPVLPASIEHVEITKKPEKKKRFKNKSFDHFLWALAQRESGNNWTIYNKWGYMGKYQFGEIALKELGYDGCFTFEEFKKNPSVFPEWLQDELIVEYIKTNKRYLRRYIREYSGDTIEGVHITESGIIAAAHLVGSGSTGKWFRNNGKVDIKDGNGVSIKHYLELFKGYQIN